MTAPRPGAAARGDADPRPGFTSVQRRLAWGLALLLVVTQFALVSAVWTARQTERALAVNVDLDGAFSDVTRLLGRLELVVARAERLDDPEVVTATQLLGRPVLIARERLDLPGTATRLRQDILGTTTAYDAFLELQAQQPLELDAAATILSEAEANAKAAADRIETANRTSLLASLARTSRTSGTAALAAATGTIVGAWLLLTVLRRFRRAYTVAYDSAVQRAAELEATNSELAHSNAALRDADRARQRFVSVLTHELRNPMSVMRGLAETLHHHRHELPEARVDGFLERIVHQADRQRGLVDDLVSMVRSTQPGTDDGDASPRPEPAAVDLAEVVAEVLDDDRSGAALHAVVEVPPAARVWADRRHVTQVLENLVTNAGHHGGGRLWVRARTLGPVVELVVEDDGPGVPEDVAADLFDAFRQGDGEARPEGLGLGLSITRSLLRANGGSIAHRAREGGGAAFVVVLPHARTGTGGYVLD